MGILRQTSRRPFLVRFNPNLRGTYGKNPKSSFGVLTRNGCKESKNRGPSGALGGSKWPQNRVKMAVFGRNGPELAGAMESEFDRCRSLCGKKKRLLLGNCVRGLVGWTWKNMSRVGKICKKREKYLKFILKEGLETFLSFPTGGEASPPSKIDQNFKFNK